MHISVDEKFAIRDHECFFDAEIAQKVKLKNNRNGKMADLRDRTDFTDQIWD